MALVKKYIPDSQLYHDLKAMDRNNFSYNGAKALMEYLEELSDEMGEDIEYDPIALCCDYAEYSEDEYEGLADEYQNAPQLSDFDGDIDAHNEAIIDWLRDDTKVIEFNGGVIIQSF